MLEKFCVKETIISKIILLLIFISFSEIHGQTFTDSNLPIVIITTDINPSTNLPLDIVDSPRVLANMKIIKRPDGTRNYLTDGTTTAFLNYNGRISIETRGSSSQSLPKKGYGLTTLKADNVSNNNVGLLGMPSENDWILNSLAFDPSLIRDYLSYNLSRQIGNYATRTVYCEAVINGEYKGLYLLQEKIKADSNRVNVLKITTADIATPNLTGGYITKADKTTGGDPVAWNMPSYSLSTDFIHDLPKPENVTPEQNTYIYNQFLNLASTSNVNNSSLVNGYPSIIDMPTFIDFMIINELASNVDGYQFSTYFHKDRNGKLRAGPIWDFNLTYGNDLFSWGFDRSKTNIWQFANGDNTGPKFWTDLFNNSIYKCYLSKRWNQLIQTSQPLNYSSLVTYIDATVAYISEATVRENQKWGTIPNHPLEITHLKTFLSDRILWITNHVGSYSSCNVIQVPSLVIDKINYNPSTSTTFPASNDLEFIDIKNIGTTTVNLTGVYFKELGISYVFPANSTILPNQNIYLASNPTTFQLKYNIVAFGQFTRNLSNSSQKLVLADGYGNTIDYVEYFDSSPWPNADGNGNYLQLISPELDNNLASSWVATSSESLAVSSFSNSNTIYTFPNPISNLLTVHASKEIIEIEVFDVLGTLIYVSNEKTDTFNVDFSSYSKGIYFVKLTNELGSTTKKVIKQ